VTLVAVTGLKREGRILAGPGLRVIAGGGDGVRLERDIEAAASGAAGIISIGLGGALAAGLRPGDWVVARGIVTSDGRIATDAAWAGRLAAGLPGAQIGDVFGSDAMLVDAAAKRALFAASGALAVDMESHIAARVAARHGLPFACARVISDGADRALPPAAQAGMGPDGGMDVLAVLRSLAADPRQLPALIRTAMEAETAFRALFRGRQLLGPALRAPGPDLGELLVDVG
jgi:hopanoid-associated phosphorylase